MKTLLRSAARGFLWGILAHYLFTLGISLILRLGYYAPCLVSMGERFGGKLNGALVECLCAAILGAGLALLLPIHKRLRAHRLASASVLLLVGKQAGRGFTAVARQVPRLAGLVRFPASCIV